MSIRTCTIIVSHGNTKNTLECVASLIASESPVKIVVVDNSSQNPGLTRTSVAADDVEILCPQENLGFSRGCNLGIAWALQHTECEFMLLLHNDTLVRPDTVPFLEGIMDEHPDAALVGGRVVFNEDPTKLYYGGGSISWRTGGSRVHGFGKNTMDAKALRSRAVSFAPECAMLLRREFLAKSGGLSEAFFMYEEGVDISLRVARSGYKLLYCPEAVIMHQGHGIPGRSGLTIHGRWSASVPGYDFRIYHLVRNAVINARRHARGRERLTFLTLYPLYVFWNATKASRKLGLRAFIPAWRGWKAGFKEPLVVSRE